MNELMTTQIALPNDAIRVLQSSLYPSAQAESVELASAYCRAAGLDVMLKPVHIVPMWDNNTRTMRDVIMPGIGLYRILAARTGAYAGMSEPVFGPMVRDKIGGVDISYPEWCRVTVRRVLAGGQIAEFSAVEFWMENYATKGGKERSIAPNAMWARRPMGQLAKCAEAQALRKGFPEVGQAPTAEEMEGRDYGNTIEQPAAPRHMGEIKPVVQAIAAGPSPGLLAACEEAAAQGVTAYADLWRGLGRDERRSLAAEHERLKGVAAAADAAKPDGWVTKIDAAASREDALAILEAGTLAVGDADRSLLADAFERAWTEAAA